MTDWNTVFALHAIARSAQVDTAGSVPGSIACVVSAVMVAAALQPTDAKKWAQLNSDMDVVKRSFPRIGTQLAWWLALPTTKEAARLCGVMGALHDWRRAAPRLDTMKVSLAFGMKRGRPEVPKRYLNRREDIRLLAAALGKLREILCAYLADAPLVAQIDKVAKRVVPGQGGRGFHPGGKWAHERCLTGDALRLHCSPYPPDSAAHAAFHAKMLLHRYKGTAPQGVATEWDTLATMLRARFGGIWDETLDE